MTSVNPNNTRLEKSVELTPSYKLPLGIIILALAIIAFQTWLGAIIALLGFFLAFQAATIKLKFTDVALDVYRGEKLLKNFPYCDWLNWEIFSETVPILFYFREVKSIHFLPILFDPKTLKSCLEEKFPKKGADR
ncbi:MAG: DUF3119 family protein [Prochloraceae cyanobacterium]|nr:DUF3119 family protein [Prochloraceae cyanobacterium]